MDQLKITVGKSVSENIRQNLVKHNSLMQQDLPVNSDGLFFILYDRDRIVASFRIAAVRTNLEGFTLRRHNIKDCFEVTHFFFDQSYRRSGAVPYGLFTCGKWASDNLKINNWIARVETANPYLLESVGIKTLDKRDGYLIAGNFHEHMNLLSNLKNLNVDIHYSEASNADLLAS